LDVSLNVEALVMVGADKRTTLLPGLDQRLQAVDALAAMSHGPAALGIALWTAGPFGSQGPGVLAVPERDYQAMTGKNIFFGPPAPAVAKAAETDIEPLRHTILTDITTDYARS